MVGRSADDADFAPGLGHVQDLDNAGCVRVAVASLTMARHDNRRGSEPGCAVVNNQLFTGSHLRRTCPVRNFRAGRAAAHLQRFQSCGNRPFCIVIHSAFAVDRNAVSIRRIADGLFCCLLIAVPPVKAEIPRSPDRSGRSPKVPYACRCRQSFLRPAR